MKVLSLLIGSAVATSATASSPAGFYFDSVEFANERRAQIVRDVNGNPKSTWLAAETPVERFANKPYSVLRMFGAGILGGVVGENEAGLPTKTLADFQTRYNGTIPDAFESSDNWPQCPILLEIRDQSACGSCYAVSAASTATDRFCIAHNGTKSDRLSGVDLMSCCKSCAGGNGGCFGGTPSHCWDYMSTQGIATGGKYLDNSKCLAYPFGPCNHHVHGTHPDCPDTPYNAPTCFWECDTNTTDKNTYDQEQAAHVFATSYVVDKNEAAIQTDILAHGPAQASMFLVAEFEVYKSGVFTTTSKDYIGGHAVKIVGWGVDNGVKYWRVQNSWNSEWGESGYFRIERGVDCLAIEDGVVGGTWGSKW